MSARWTCSFASVSHASLAARGESRSSDATGRERRSRDRAKYARSIVSIAYLNIRPNDFEIEGSMKMTSLGVTVSIAAALNAAPQRIKPQQAVPVDPVTAIIDAFRSYPLVVLGEGHGRAPDQAFRLALIRDPRFSSAVNDIIVECGNAAFQDVMDRFMSGADVPRESLQQVWLNAAEAFRAPMYEELIRAVRAVNDGLAPDRRIRILLGEAPDHRRRDAFVANMIRREVLDRHRRGLVIYGNLHGIRMHPTGRDDADEERTLVTILEQTGTKVFSVWGHRCAELARLQPGVSSWSTPSLAIIRGTTLGAADYASYMSFGAWRLKDGEPVFVDGHPVVDPPRPGLRMEQQVDAVLCLAP
jgi:hypothetical protein